MMKVFVPGGNGFLGKHVLMELQKYRNYEAIGLSRSDGIDFRDYNQTFKIFRDGKFDIVINCASYVGGIQFGYKHFGEIFFNNTLISTNLIDTARRTGVKMFINPISNCSYPARLTKNFKESEWWDGEMHESVMVYGFVRKGSWVQLWAYKKQYDFNSISFIMPNMYGPGDHFDEERSHALGALIMKIVEAKFKRNERVTIWGSGKPIREWLYVKDAAEILVKAISAKPELYPINVGVGKGISIIELANLIKEIVGYKGELVLDKSKPDGAPWKTMDNTRLKEKFHWQPPTPLREGIKATVEWYIKEKGYKWKL